MMPTTSETLSGLLASLSTEIELSPYLARQPTLPVGHAWALTRKPNAEHVIHEDSPNESIFPLSLTSKEIAHLAKPQGKILIDEMWVLNHQKTPTVRDFLPHYEEVATDEITVGVTKKDEIVSTLTIQDIQQALTTKTFVLLEKRTEPTITKLVAPADSETNEGVLYRVTENTETVKFYPTSFHAENENNTWSASGYINKTYYTVTQHQDTLSLTTAKQASKNEWFL